MRIEEFCKLDDEEQMILCVILALALAAVGTLGWGAYRLANAYLG